MAYDYTKNWKEVMQQSYGPCLEMYNIVSSKWVDVTDTMNSKNDQIEVDYQLQYYQELRYFADFDLETFISNIGGFVGIFLGYSMMQLPELLGIILKLLVQFFLI